MMVRCLRESRRSCQAKRVGRSLLKMSPFEYPLTAPIFPTVWQTQVCSCSACRFGTCSWMAATTILWNLIRHGHALGNLAGIHRQVALDVGWSDPTKVEPRRSQRPGWRNPPTVEAPPVVDGAVLVVLICSIFLFSFSRYLAKKSCHWLVFWHCLLGGLFSPPVR